MRIWAWLLVSMTAACGSVELPEEHYYRLDHPSPGGGELVRAGALRVGPLQLAPHLRNDRLMIAEGPVVVQPYHFHRWAGPLESMIVEVLVTGFERSRAFAHVAGPSEPGGEDLWLTGRVLDFQQQIDGEEWSARVTVDLRLVHVERGTVFRDEFTRDVPVRENHPEAVVTALSEGLAEVVDLTVARAREAGLFERNVEASPR